MKEHMFFMNDHKDEESNLSFITEIDIQQYITLYIIYNIYYFIYVIEIMKS